ncbi:hypothetical protein PINS_up014796 [Pythium insidiosum]|nr:hypothetical protein PINS_up014796 [Pythium insidiosum]
MYISVPRLDADYMANVSIDVLADFFSLPLDRDEEISTGIYVSKPGPLRPLAEMMHKAVQECGQKLKERGFSDLGAFVLAHLRSTESSSPSAAHLVESLVETFPAFDDHREYRGASCFFLKRAQLVAVSLYRRFQETNEEFRFEDVSELTALSDNVLPCVLRALGILECTAQVAEHIDRGENLPPGDWESDLRAGAIVACDRIVLESKGRVTNLDLDTYLWRVGKEPRFRGLERHATRDTFFY